MTPRTAAPPAAEVTDTDPETAVPWGEFVAVEAGQNAPALAVIDDWPRMIRVKNNLGDTRARLAAALAGETVADGNLLWEIRAHNMSIGPLRTRETAQLAETVQRVHFANRHVPAGATHGFVAVDGSDAGMGKSTAMAAVAFGLCEDRWNASGLWPDHDMHAEARHFPVAYVEVTSTSGEKGLMWELADFLGLDPASASSAAVIKARIRKFAPQLRTEMIVVDDAHQLSTARGNDRATLTDFLKGVVSSLPITVVFIGNRLADSALMRSRMPELGPAVEQLRKRQNTVRFVRYDHDDAEDVRRFTKTIGTLERLMILDGRDLTGSLANPATIDHLMRESQGCLGDAITWIREAAFAAVGRPEPFDLAWLRKFCSSATRPNP